MGRFDANETALYFDKTHDLNGGIVEGAQTSNNKGVYYDADTGYGDPYFVDPNYIDSFDPFSVSKYLNAQYDTTNPLPVAGYGGPGQVDPYAVLNPHNFTSTFIIRGPFATNEKSGMRELQTIS
jgi:hypothetical protein